MLIFVLFTWQSSTNLTIKDFSSKIFNQLEFFKPVQFRGTILAQWIRLHLPSCRPRFKPQTHHLCFIKTSAWRKLMFKVIFIKMSPGICIAFLFAMILKVQEFWYKLPTTQMIGNSSWSRSYLEGRNIHKV